jgi:hypothetical protein
MATNMKLLNGPGDYTTDLKGQCMLDVVLQEPDTAPTGPEMRVNLITSGATPHGNRAIRLYNAAGDLIKTIHSSGANYALYLLANATSGEVSEGATDYRYNCAQAEFGPGSKVEVDIAGAADPGAFIQQVQVGAVNASETQIIYSWKGHGKGTLTIQFEAIA